jgi:hypothetical protein
VKASLDLWAQAVTAVWKCQAPLATTVNMQAAAVFTVQVAVWLHKRAKEHTPAKALAQAVRLQYQSPVLAVRLMVEALPPHQQLTFAVLVTGLQPPHRQVLAHGHGLAVALMAVAARLIARQRRLWVDHAAQAVT